MFRALQLWTLFKILLCKKQFIILINLILSCFLFSHFSERKLEKNPAVFIITGCELAYKWIRAFLSCSFFHYKGFLRISYAKVINIFSYIVFICIVWNGLDRRILDFAEMRRLRKDKLKLSLSRWFFLVLQVSREKNDTAHLRNFILAAKRRESSNDSREESS